MRTRRWSRRALVLGASLLVVASSVLPLPGTAADGRWGRQRDDPIAVARRQREALHGRIENQAERLSRLRTASRDLHDRIDRTEAKLADITSSLDDVRAEVAAARADLAAAEHEHGELVGQLEVLDWNLEQLAGQADELAADLEERRRELGARLAEAYRTGQTGLWEQIIDARSLIDVVVREAGLLSYARRDQELAEGIREDQEALDARRRDIRHLRWETDQVRAEVAADADAIAAERDRLLRAEARLAEREAAVETLRAEQVAHVRQLARTREEVAELIADQKAEAIRLGARIRRMLEREQHAGRLPSAFNRTLRWPLRGRVSQEFGCTGFELEPAYGDCAHFHGGIDIVAEWAAPVVAPADGVVLFVGYDPDVPRAKASWQVVIAHSSRLFTTYGHLIPGAPDGVRAGARVREGQRIGSMGNTGKSTGAHLHWGVWFDGEPVNPRYFL